jgi:hypothetical protein
MAIRIHNVKSCATSSLDFCLFVVAMACLSVTSTPLSRPPCPKFGSLAGRSSASPTLWKFQRYGPSPGPIRRKAHRLC